MSDCRLDGTPGEHAFYDPIIERLESAVARRARGVERCHGKRKDGKRCSRFTTHRSGYCWEHR